LRHATPKEDDDSHFVEQRLLEWLGRYGPVVLFCAQMFGIFGLPIPDELLLTVAGALARQGQLPLVVTFLAALAGCMCGITLSYVLGRTVGVAAMHRVKHVSSSAVARAQRWFARFGCWLLMFGYFIPGVRHVTAIVAGSTPVNYRTFAMYAYTGAVLWCLTFVTLGYIAGSQWRRVFNTAQHAAPYVGIPLVIVIGIVIYVMTRRGRY